jgi:hypothetical protein
MARRKQGRSDQTVRVSFEITRLSECVMIEVYEQLLPLVQRRPRPLGETAKPTAGIPEPAHKLRR